MEPGDRKTKLLAESVLEAWADDYLAAQQNNNKVKMEELIAWALKKGADFWAKILRDDRFDSLRAKYGAEESPGSKNE